MAPVTVLNVAEKPSVARALAGVFSRMPGSQDRPMERRDAQIFTHENVCFPSVMQQGSGQPVNGPSKYCMIESEIVVCALLLKIMPSLLTHMLPYYGSRTAYYDYHLCERTSCQSRFPRCLWLE